jgi:hypothetical protein
MTKQKISDSIMAWSRTISSMPLAEVAQPGIASGVASRRKTVTARPRRAADARRIASTSRRTPMTSR